MTEDSRTHRLVEWLLSTSVVEDAMARCRARDKIVELAAKIVEHAYKVLRWPEHQSHYHWARELRTWVRDVLWFAERPKAQLDHEDQLDLIFRSGRVTAAADEVAELALDLGLDPKVEAQRVHANLTVMEAFVRTCMDELGHQHLVTPQDVQWLALRFRLV